MDQSSKNSWQWKTVVTVFLLINLAGLCAYLGHLLTGWMPTRIWLNPFQLLTVYWSGVYLLVAFALGFGIAYLQPTFCIEPDQSQLLNRPLTILLLGWVGARLLDVLFLSPVSLAQGIRSPNDYFSNPLFLIDTNWGGLNLWGGITTVFIWLIWRCWWKEVPLTPVLFKGVIGLLVGSAISQWAHFLTQQNYGRPYVGLGSIFIQPEYRLPEMLEVATYFPVFLFGAIWFLGGSFWLMFGSRWQEGRSGQMDGLLLGCLWFISGKLVLELAALVVHFNGLFGLLAIVLILASVLFKLLRK